MISDRAGDNAQVLAAAEALGLPYETRRFRTRRGAIAANLLFGPRLASGLVEPLDPIAPPWPDLVIAAGTQSEPLLALLRHCARQEGRVLRQVFLGRPWMRPDCYDLVVTTPQYFVPPAPNVLEIDLPLHGVTAARIAEAAARWAPRFSKLPRPFVAVLLGGGISRYSLDARAGRRLATQAGARASRIGGTVLVCGGPRTPSSVLKVIEANLSVPAFVYDWHRDRGADNPYLPLLGLADEIVVSGDSMSMLAEARATGKPVFIFDLGEGRFAMRDAPPPVDAPGPRRASALRAILKDAKVRLINAVLPRRLHRDTRHVHRRLVASGRAVWLGDDAPKPGGMPPDADPAAVAARIRTLL